MSRLFILCLLWIAEIRYVRNMNVCSDSPRDPDILARVSDYPRSPDLLLGPDCTPGKPYKPGSTYTPVSTNPGVPFRDPEVQSIPGVQTSHCVMVSAQVAAELTNPVQLASIYLGVSSRHGTGSHFVTQRPSHPESSDPET